LVIRPVLKSEVPELLSLLRGKAEFDGSLQSLVATTETLQEALFSERPSAYALVAEVDGKLVGMATYYAIFSSFIVRPGLWMDDLFVYESYRGRGIGEALVRELCRVAQTGGCARLDWVVSAANERGKKFYSRIGATIFEKGRLVRLNEERINALAAIAA
jgi:GNAT superfamily N-acetyltransferase